MLSCWSSATANCHSACWHIPIIWKNLTSIHFSSSVLQKLNMRKKLLAPTALQNKHPPKWNGSTTFFRTCHAFLKNELFEIWTFLPSGNEIKLQIVSKIILLTNQMHTIPVQDLKIVKEATKFSNHLLVHSLVVTLSREYILKQGVSIILDNKYKPHFIVINFKMFF